MLVPFTVTDFLDRAATVYPDRVGAVDEPAQPADSQGELTYAEIADLAQRQAAKLDELGIVGDELAFLEAATWPTEAEHRAALAPVLSGLAGRTATVRVRKDAGLVCYRLHAESITLPAVAAHIHRGGATANGPVVVPFQAPGASGNSDGCATAQPAIIDEILANPSNFYVNVHTTEHPAGAMRAQLG